MHHIQSYFLEYYFLLMRSVGISTVHYFYCFTFRMFENKLKEMESEIARKNQTISDLKQKLQKPTESGDKHENCIEDYLKEQVRFYFYLFGAFRSAAWQVSAIFLAYFFSEVVCPRSPS